MEVFIEPFNFSFFSITGQDIDLDYRDIEWFALETNRDHSVIFEIASKYCILDSFVDYDGYSVRLPYTLRGFPGGSEVKVSASNEGDLGSIPGSGRSPGEGNGNPLQYYCLENPMDGEAW